MAQVALTGRESVAIGALRIPCLMITSVWETVLRGILWAFIHQSIQQRNDGAVQAATRPVSGIPAARRDKVERDGVKRRSTEAGAESRFISCAMAGTLRRCRIKHRHSPSSPIACRRRCRNAHTEAQLSRAKPQLPMPGVWMSWLYWRCICPSMCCRTRIPTRPRLRFRVLDGRGLRRPLAVGGDVSATEGVRSHIRANVTTTPSLSLVAASPVVGSESPPMRTSPYRSRTYRHPCEMARSRAEAAYRQPYSSSRALANVVSDSAWARVSEPRANRRSTLRVNDLSPAHAPRSLFGLSSPISLETRLRGA